MWKREPVLVLVFMCRPNFGNRPARDLENSIAFRSGSTSKLLTSLLLGHLPNSLVTRQQVRRAPVAKMVGHNSGTVGPPIWACPVEDFGWDQLKDEESIKTRDLKNEFDDFYLDHIATLQDVYDQHTTEWDKRCMQFSRSAPIDMDLCHDPNWDFPRDKEMDEYRITQGAYHEDDTLWDHVPRPAFPEPSFNDPAYLEKLETRGGDDEVFLERKRLQFPVNQPWYGREHRTKRKIRSKLEELGHIRSDRMWRGSEGNGLEAHVLKKGGTWVDYWD
mmetsp:Transcript_63806/g.101116  ORF Transcript_63806/g.101116 Transcript_63806/m.101116 type:complete len:275 (+) Transcript_63806:84-908(+)